MVFGQPVAGKAERFDMAGGFQRDGQRFADGAALADGDEVKQRKLNDV